MKIKERFGQERPLFSFEFFPPKDDRGVDALFETVARLKALEPAFVSVTYGAGGSTREKTVTITQRIKSEAGIEAMAHLTCVGHSRDEIDQLLDEYEEAGIENIMALRGDPPRGDTEFVPHPQGFSHANELIAFIRQRKDFCIGGAGYPEVHPEAPSAEEDLGNLKRKIDAGADFVVTQLFFDERDYFDFVSRVRSRGVVTPIVPGVMPITNTAQIKRFTQMCGATIPAPLLAKLEAVTGDADAVIEVGVEHATRQCRALLQGGAPGIHFYTLNRSLSTRKILANLQGA
ncbi:MAG: methylenetetrahydrofolate reductase [NAD(P)H] [Deltaproteobacteria bacterium]|nr:methylenetetrahydrofolate reductase [NAD(P)H] [Deltaproteobacteria bacterium]